MVDASDQSLCSFRQEITLLDGQRVDLRPICFGDKDALRAFHSRLSENTRFLRYQYLKGELTENDLQNFCDVDNVNTLALVAETARDGHKEIIGVGRYYRLANPHNAEVAFVVQDSEQRKGIGTQLLKYLAILAWQRDIQYFVAELLRINGKMISIFTKSDPKLTHIVDNHTTCTITLSVEEAIRRAL